MTPVVPINSDSVSDDDKADSDVSNEIDRNLTKINIRVNRFDLAMCNV